MYVHDVVPTEFFLVSHCIVVYGTTVIMLQEGTGDDNDEDADDW